MRYLEKLGVDRSFIMVEETTSTTVQQIQLIKNKFSEDPKYRKISIVSDQFHMARIMEMSKFFTLQTDGIASDYKLKIEKLLYYRLRESIALLLFWLFAI